NSVAADFFNGIFPHENRRAQPEFHSFEKIGGQDAGGHFHRHADRVEPGPESSGILAAIEASQHADLRIEHRGNYLAQIIRRDFDVAVARDENVVRGNLRHAIERIGWRIWPGRTPRDQDPRADVRVTRADFADDAERGIVFFVGSEENFVVRVLLQKKALDILLQARFKAVDG